MQGLRTRQEQKYRDIRIAGKHGFYKTLIQRIFSDRNYLFLIGKIFKIKILKQKTPIFAIIDINNICNLKCKHCYWWLTRDNEKPKLSTDDWKKIIYHYFKKNHILQVNLVGGEPMLRPDIIEVFNEEMSGKFTIITNGTYKLIPYSGLINYFISIDGMKETHDKIRGKTFDKIVKTVQEYKEETGKKIWINMTINSINCNDVVDVVEYWKNLAESIAFHFHTPFAENDPLWIPYGDKKNEIIDQIILLKKKYPQYIVNEIKQLNLLRSTWGGNESGPTNCPNWAIMTLDHQAQVKTPCCLGSAGENDTKPMCQNCGLSNYSSLLVHGIHL
jgi:MoaA/NifB/PqqE/SkfB family radical SAM enzyme